MIVFIMMAIDINALDRDHPLYNYVSGDISHSTKREDGKKYWYYEKNIEIEIITIITTMKSTI